MGNDSTPKPAKTAFCCVIALGSAICLLSVGLYVSSERARQWHMSKYIERTYLPNYRLSRGAWPTSLAGLEADLRDHIDHPDLNGRPNVILSGKATELLGIYMRLHPTITEIHSNAQSYDGLLKYNWIFGDTDRISAAVPLVERQPKKSEVNRIPY